MLSPSRASPWRSNTTRSSYRQTPSDDYAGSNAEKIAEKMHVTVAEARAMKERITDTARAVGLELDYKRMKPAKTLKAHELLHYAKQHAKQRENERAPDGGVFHGGPARAAGRRAG